MQAEASNYGKTPYTSASVIARTAALHEDREGNLKASQVCDRYDLMFSL